MVIWHLRPSSPDPESRDVAPSVPPSVDVCCLLTLKDLSVVQTMWFFFTVSVVWFYQALSSPSCRHNVVNPQLCARIKTTIKLTLRCVPLLSSRCPIPVSDRSSSPGGLSGCQCCSQIPSEHVSLTANSNNVRRFCSFTGAQNRRGDMLDTDQRPHHIWIHRRETSFVGSQGRR